MHRQQLSNSHRSATGNALRSESDSLEPNLIPSLNTQIRSNDAIDLQRLGICFSPSLSVKANMLTRRADLILGINTSNSISSDSALPSDY